MIVALALVGLGVIIGVAAVRSFRDVAQVLEEEERQRITIEQGKEIARLRAQVANLVGRE